MLMARRAWWVRLFLRLSSFLKYCSAPGGTVTDPGISGDRSSGASSGPREAHSHLTLLDADKGVRHSLAGEEPGHQDLAEQEWGCPGVGHRVLGTQGAHGQTVGGAMSTAGVCQVL